jgi:uncharacterized membrane protein YidH (DUF202 family)
MSDLCRAKCHCDRFLSKHLGFLLSVSFHQRPLHMHSVSITQYICILSVSLSKYAFCQYHSVNMHSVSITQYICILCSITQYIRILSVSLHQRSVHMHSVSITEYICILSVSLSTYAFCQYHSVHMHSVSITQYICILHTVRS